MQLLQHAATCDSTAKECPSANCSKMKGLLRHGAECKQKVQGGCSVCKRIWAMLQIHARQCKLSKCPVQSCTAIRERARRIGTTATQPSDLQQSNNSGLPGAIVSNPGFTHETSLSGGGLAPNANTYTYTYTYTNTYTYTYTYTNTNTNTNNTLCQTTSTDPSNPNPNPNPTSSSSSSLSSVGTAATRQNSSGDGDTLIETEGGNQGLQQILQQAEQAEQQAKAQYEQARQAVQAAKQALEQHEEE
ncbi:hypothetical protein ScalyP_jg6560 [Parmales sp. scaly parma]|nr:hypothetical protein ScalyP_jg6560 [Parmales sp. scaly parma]